MTLDQLQARLHALHARIGFDGRLNLTVGPDAGGACRITHWYRPARYAPLTCRTVGAGTAADCLAALERYVASGQVADEAYAIAAE
ncbi:MAG TPA: hypothetical protein VFO41_12775 [Alphaproteobacteria bacterium]|nr:hypothetical protein [Alphaproteobacteria bacterium]